MKWKCWLLGHKDTKPKRMHSFEKIMIGEMLISHHDEDADVTVCLRCNRFYVKYSEPEGLGAGASPEPSK